MTGVFDRIVARNVAFWNFLTDPNLSHEERKAEFEKALEEETGMRPDILVTSGEDMAFICPQTKEGYTWVLNEQDHQVKIGDVLAIPISEIEEVLASARLRGLIIN